MSARAAAKRRLADSIPSVAAVARALGVHPSTVEEWCDPTRPLSPALGDLDAMPRSVRRAYYELAAADCYEALGLAPEHHAIKTGAESGDVASATLEAAPRGFDDDELGRLIREHVEAIEAHAQAVRDLRAMRARLRVGE